MSIGTDIGDGKKQRHPAESVGIPVQTILSPTAIELQAFKVPDIAEAVPVAFGNLDGADQVCFLHIIQARYPECPPSFPNLIDIHRNSPFPHQRADLKQT